MSDHSCFANLIWQIADLLRGPYRPPQYERMTRFDYFLTNSPFGVNWKRQQKAIRRERGPRGFDGRWGARLPRITDGSLLFPQHMSDEFESVAPAERKHGSRLLGRTSGARRMPEGVARVSC